MGKGSRNRAKREAAHSAPPEFQLPTGFGSLLHAFEPHAPLLVTQMRRDDQTRIEIMHHLTTRRPDALRALEELQVLSDLHVEWAARSGDRLAHDIALRIRSDYRDGVASLLTRDFAGVMDVCRDLMELSMLARDFAEEPQRAAKWSKADERTRGRDYSFNALLAKHALGLGVNEVAAAQLRGEYAIHSATLHAAQWKITAHELTREQEIEMPVEVWVITSSAELVRHMKLTGGQILDWLARRFPKIDIPDDTRVPDLSVVDGWLATVRRLQAGFEEEALIAMRASDPRRSESAPTT